VIRIFARILLACAVAAVAPAAGAQGAAPPSRGELLYSTYCIACHTQQIHWREQKLVRDWASLDGQVRRWARNGGLPWSDDDVAEVARYLNALHYRLPAPSATGAEGGDIPRRMARST
jgi:mono/diheme cytochrome c family protein